MRQKLQIHRLIFLGLAAWLPLAPATSAKPKDSSTLRQTFLKMFARSYFPGRSGQIMIVPRQGEIITRPDPAYRFMHGSPWDYDIRIPLLLYGSSRIRRGTYSDSVAHQDIAPTIAALLRVPMPATATGRPLKQALDLSVGPPRVVFLAVLDAMRVDYFDRYASLLPTLSRLRQKGAWFTQARVNYLPSATAVAHATISTGSDPRVHGMVVNTFYNSTKREQEDPFPGMSPRNLMALTLTDVWNAATEGQAVIIAQGSLFYAAGGLAGHGACLLNGHPVIVASYNRSTGGWDSSPECYRLPEYLKNRNSRSIWEEADGTWRGHNIAGPEAVRRSALFSRFEADSLLAMFEEEPVGSNDLTDLIFANLKTPDFVGHQFGPDSTETKETIAELDRQLARILSALEAKSGSSGYVVVITADHGMPPEPSGDQKRHFPAEIADLIHKKFDPEQGSLVVHYEASNSQFYVNKTRLKELGLKLAQIKDYLEAQSFIFAAFTEEEVSRASLH